MNFFMDVLMEDGVMKRLDLKIFLCNGLSVPTVPVKTHTLGRMQMSTVTIVLLVILVILIAALIGLYFFGKKAQKKQEEQQAQIEATKQTVSMLVIDKKRMPLKESGLPQMVIEQTPKLMRRSKLPIVKAKIGPKIAIMIADEKVFDLIPVKKE